MKQSVACSKPPSILNSVRRFSPAPLNIYISLWFLLQAESKRDKGGSKPRLVPQSYWRNEPHNRNQQDMALPDYLESGSIRELKLSTRDVSTHQLFGTNTGFHC